MNKIFKKILILCIFISINLNIAQCTDMDLILLSENKYPDAKCLDGS